MEQKQMEKILLLAKKIEKESGDSSIYSLGSKKSLLSVPRVPSGIEDLDYITGGGMPVGRMVEIYGPESSGKTTLSFHLASKFDMCLYIPAEGTFDASRARVMGNRPKQMLVYNNKFGEDAMAKTMEFAKLGIPLVIIDSVPFLMPREEFEAVDKDMEKNLRIGGIARMMTKVIPPLTKVCEKSGTTIIFINQVRDKMDAMMFGEKTQTPGGRILKHAYSLRIQVGRKDWIQIPNKDPRSSAAQEKIGLIIKTKVTKSKICNPYGEAELPALFQKGFVSHEEALEIRREVMAEKRKRRNSEEEE